MPDLPRNNLDTQKEAEKISNKPGKSLPRFLRKIVRFQLINISALPGMLFWFLIKIDLRFLARYPLKGTPVLEISPAVQEALEKVRTSLEHLRHAEVTPETYNAASERHQKQRETIVKEMSGKQQTEILSLGKTIRLEIKKQEQALEELRATLRAVQDICPHNWNIAHCVSCGVSASR